MMKFHRTRFLRTTALAGLALGVAAPALAQDDEEPDTIVVTGSRLEQANVFSTSPVTSVGSEEFIARGTVDAIDLVNIIPSTFAGQSSEVSNGATGVSTLNLRGLGATRTLVLVDGKRLPAGRASSLPGGAGFASDLNIIPAPLIERVEIVTGGASAVYGSDAIGGVANFILRRDFEGLEINALGGFNQDNNNNNFAQQVLRETSTDGVVPDGRVTDGRTLDISGIFGANTPDGKGNVTGYVRYFDQRAILQGTRDGGRCALSDDFTGTGGVTCLGSNFGPFPTTFSLSPRFGPDGLPIPDPDGVVQGTVSLDAQGNVPRDPVTGEVITGATNPFNFNPLNFYQRPITRFNAGFFARYEIAKEAELYLDFGFTDNFTDAQIAPSGTFGEVQNVNCDNPFLTDELLQIICTDRGLSGSDLSPVQLNRRLVESGGRNSAIEQTNYRFVGGMRGEVEGFNYDVFAQFATTRQTDINTNDFQIDFLNDAILAVEDGDGNITCGPNAFDGCLPLNLFGTGPADPDAIAAVAVPNILTGRLQQTVLGGTVSTDMGRFGFVSPLAEDGVQLLGGFEWRRDALQNLPDSILATGNATGLGGPTTPVDAETTVWEVFTETSIPVIQGAPLIEDLSISGAYRYSNYGATDFSGPVAQSGGDFETNTFAAGLSWSPVSDIRFRGQFQRAVRAPNVFNLFSAQSLSLFDDTDPCSGADPAGAGSEFANRGFSEAEAIAACEASGLNPALFGVVPPDAGQLQELSGGNPDLQPETSDTITAGFVLQPRVVPGLTFSVDYFDIEVEDFITTVPGNQIVDNCLFGGDPNFCALFSRDQIGSIQIDGFVEATLQNVASYSTRGVDFNINYSFDAVDFGLPDVGGFDINLISTYLDELEFQSLPTADPVDCAGNFNGVCEDLIGNPSFQYRQNLSTTWRSNFDVDIRLLWRYLSSVDNLDAGATFEFAESFDAENYFDLFINWQVRDDLSLNAGVNNLANNDAPLSVFNRGNGNTYPSVYDASGRFVFFGARLNL